MPKRFLSGADARFSDCFLVVTYRFKGGKLNSTQETTIMNINRNNFDAPVVDKEGPVRELSKRFKKRVQNNQALSVIVNAEQVPVESVTKAIDETRNYFIRDVSGKSFVDVVMATVPGNSFGNRVVKRPGVNCNFGFVFKYESKGSEWDDRYLRDNNIKLRTSNPDIRKIVDIDKGEITEEDFAVRGGTLTIDFTINQKEVTQDEITAITNAVDGYVRRATSGTHKQVSRMLTVV